MMGFVAALSSSMAFIILIMSAQLLNVISVRAQREKQAQSIQISSEIVYHDVDILPGSNTTGGDGGYSYYISGQQARALKNLNKQINLYCTYGNNFSLEVAKRISAYNYIILKNSKENLQIHLINPQLNTVPSKKDSCYLTTENK